jgi:hypothetical protein
VSPTAGPFFWGAGGRAKPGTNAGYSHLTVRSDHHRTVLATDGLEHGHSRNEA